MVLKHRYLLALAVALTLALARGGAAEAYHGELIRLHVVAADDSAAAQALKLRVRDACLARARALLADCPGVEEAWAVVNGCLDDFEAAAAGAIEAAGAGERVAASAGIYAFPVRWYGGARVPAGRYRALRVVIGPGKGRNWWCVLYPSLCLGEAYEPGTPVRFHSALLRWLRRIFGGGEG